MAVGVILDGEHNILITRRAPDTHQGNLWEFPGGKIEDGESTASALARELREELDIEIGRTSALLKVHHDYGDKVVLLDVQVVWEFTGEARPMEGQPMVWVSPRELLDYAFPEANLSIVRAVNELLGSGGRHNGAGS